MMRSKQILGSVAIAALTSMLVLSGCSAVSTNQAAAPLMASRLSGNDKSPIANGVFVPAGMDTLYLSGQLADPANPNAPKDSPEYYGDTETQTISIMKKIERALAEKKMTMGDVAMMHVYLVADPNKGNKMDFKGLMAGYLKYFGTEQQPNKTARSTFQVAGLVAPGYLAEIEVLAVAAPK
jgi:enamine deaminase RidA (YjgF/YER057c/UK114 family)